MRYFWILVLSLLAVAAKAQQVPHSKLLSLRSPFHFVDVNRQTVSFFSQTYQPGFALRQAIIQPPPRREYIIKNGPEKHLYYNDGNHIIETCLGPTGVSCSFYLW